MAPRWHTHNEDGTPTTTSSLWAPAHGVDDGSGQQQNRVTSNNRETGQGQGSLQAAVRRVETTGTAKTGRTQRRKRRGATMTKTMGQDDTDTDNKGTDDNDNDNKGTDDNDNDNDGDQGTKTDNKEDNHHRTTPGMGTDKDMT